MNFAAAPLYGASVAVLVALLLGFARGGLDSLSASIALAGGLMTTACGMWHARYDSPRFRRLTGWEWGAVIAFSLFSLRAFLWLVFTVGDEIRVLSPNNLGDLSIHLTYIHQLANGVPLWPDNPIVSNAKLTYPFGVDLLSSLLLLGGFDTMRGLIWVGLAGCALTGFALWRWGGAFTLFGFLANGGMAGFVALRTGEILDYQGELAWKSFALALLVTQRGLLFALPAGLLLLCSWRTRYFNKGADGDRPLPLAGELLLYGTMPIFHLHTFLFLSLLLLAWFIAYEEKRALLLRFVGLSILPATVLTLLVTGSLKGPALVSWYPGWMQGEPEFLTMCAEIYGLTSPWITVPFFWLLNFGFLPFFVFGLLVAIAGRRTLTWPRAAVIPAVAIFALCCFVKFAPWAWDNTKLMIWSYIIVLPFLWSEVISKWPLWLRSVACFGLFGSGIISTFGGFDGTHRGFTIAFRSELDFVRPALRSIPATERFIAHPSYNHPLLLLGRPLVLGYTGHVWSHGYPWESEYQRVVSILQGVDDWREQAAQTGARYLFWGAQEEEAYDGSPQPWRGECRVVAEGSWGAIFDLKEPAEQFVEAPLPPLAPDETAPPPAEAEAAANGNELPQQ
jgi:hypothetical protein